MLVITLHSPITYMYILYMFDDILIVIVIYQLFRFCGHLRYL